MCSKRTTDKSSIRGNVIVELAMMLPLLLLFLVGVLEISVIVHDKTVITNASREGARFGISVLDGGYATDDQIGARVNSYVQSRLISFPPVDAATTVIRGGSATGSDLTVQVSYPYRFLVLPNFASGIASSLSLKARTTMRLE